MLRVSELPTTVPSLVRLIRTVIVSGLGDWTVNRVLSFTVDYLRKLWSPSVSEDGVQKRADVFIETLKQGRIVSVSIDYPILRIITDKGGDLTTINVDYSGSEPIREAREDSNNIHDDEWHSIALDCKSRVRHFNNCVFEHVVNVTNPKYLSFNNCFFKQGLNIKDSVNAESIAIRECFIEKGVFISESKINRLSIVDSHIDALFIDECTFERTALFKNSIYKSAIVFNHSNFDGYDSQIDHCELGEKICFNNCTSRSRFSVNRTRTKQLRFEKCSFKSLNVDDSLIECTDGTEESCVYMEGNTITGAVSFDNVKCPKLSIIRSNLYGGCYLTQHDYRSEMVVPSLEKEETLFQSVIISGDRIGNEFQIGKIYDRLRIDETEFNCKIRMNCVYTQLLSKGIIDRTNPESRLTGTEPKVLFEISNTLRMHNQPLASEYFYIAYKASKLERAEGFAKKSKYVAHDLLSRYGTSYARVIIWSVITVIVFTMLYRLFGGTDLYTALYHSGSTFFTIGFSDLEGNNDICKILSVAEGAIGLLLMTYLVIVMTNKRYRDRPSRLSGCYARTSYTIRAVGRSLIFQLWSSILKL